jgi:hypothetical protein
MTRTEELIEEIEALRDKAVKLSSNDRALIRQKLEDLVKALWTATDDEHHKS